jgi:hypothetical protein
VAGTVQDHRESMLYSDGQHAFAVTLQLFILPLEPRKHGTRQPADII